jgi:hypothetical protein
MWILPILGLLGLGAGVYAATRRPARAITNTWPKRIKVGPLGDIVAINKIMAPGFGPDGPVLGYTWAVLLPDIVKQYGSDVAAAAENGGMIGRGMAASYSSAAADAKGYVEGIRHGKLAEFSDPYSLPPVSVRLRVVQVGKLPSSYTATVSPSVPDPTNSYPPQEFAGPTVSSVLSQAYSFIQTLTTIDPRSMLQ